MKAMKKVFAMLLALAMIVTAVPVSNASAATYNMKAGTAGIITKSIYAGRSHTLKLNGYKASQIKSTKWSVGKTSVVKLSSTTKTTAKMTCVGKGYTVVTAKMTLTNKKVKTFKAKITVKNPSLTVTPGELALTVGDTAQLGVTYAPSNAKVTYASRDNGIASVSGTRVTATGAGETIIDVKLTCGTKKISKEVKVVVSNLTDGLTVMPLADAVSDQYPNSVWANETVPIRVKYVRDGKPVAGETLVMTKRAASTIKDGYVSAEGRYYNFNFTQLSTTDSNGVATFIAKYYDNDVKATSTNFVGSFDYTVATALGTASVDGQVAFAALDIGTVVNVNAHGSDNDRKAYGVEVLAPAKNDTTGDGVTTTATASTREVKNGTIVLGKDVDFVDSQKVSSLDDSVNHKVAFYQYMPHIIMPTSGKDLSGAKSFTQEITGVSDGPYSVYNSTAKQIALDVNPSELTYATLNFSKLQLSAHTKLVLEFYSSKNCDWWTYKYSDEILGEADMLANGYQIPLDERFSELGIKLILQSEGQVDTDKNAGYEVKSITGVYKTTSDGKNESVALKDAKVTWAITTPTMSNIMVLDNTDNQWIYDNAGIDLFGTATLSGADMAAIADGKKKIEDIRKYYAKVTYQVPVFPYTGNAILTCYNASGDIKAYYVCPTVNFSKIITNYDQEDYWPAGKSYDLKKTMYDNMNVLDIWPTVKRAYGTDVNGNKITYFAIVSKGGQTCYEVSKEEAFNPVGEIVEQGDNKLIVDSKYVGTTSLKGTVTINGERISALDATNDTLYTSVQWCPLPAKGDDIKPELALVGQMVDVIAQLVDINGNPATTAGQDIEFYYDSNDKVYELSKTTKTDAKGQAKMVLQSSDATVLDNLGARAKNGSGYNVKLYFSNGDTAPIARIYWVDPDLLFNESAMTSNFVQTSAADPFVVTSGAGITINPKTGSHWDYGIKVVGPTYGHEDVKIKEITAIDGINVDMSKSATSVGSITAVKNGVVNATSLKAGAMDITGKIDSTSATSTIKFTVNRFYWDEVWTGVGYGAAALNRKLTLNTVWTSEGFDISALNVNGINAAVTTAGAIKTVYVKATDKNGAAIDSVVAFVLGDPTKGTLTTVVGTYEGTTTIAGVTYLLVKPNADGIAAVKVTRTATALTSTVKAYVKLNTPDQKEVAQTIRWIDNPTEFKVDTDSKNDDHSWATNIKDGKVVLTFTDNINASSVDKGMFEVKVGTKEYEVSDFTVSGNRITLTVRNLPKDLAASEGVDVSITSKLTTEGITYVLTSDEGYELADVKVTVHDSTTDSAATKPAQAGI